MEFLIKARKELEGRAVPVPDDIAKYKGRASGRITVFYNGAQAAADDKPIEACPHKAGGHGSSSFYDHWVKGWQAWHKRNSN